MSGEHNHPHARGEEELFRFLFVYWLNIDEARRLIDNGAIEPMPVDMPVKKAGRMLLRLADEAFGSVLPGGPFPEDDENDLMATHVDRARLASIPDECMDGPALMVVWDVDKGAKLVNPKAEPMPGARPTPYLVDGNHRLARRYLEGDEGTMPCLVVQRWDDVCKFLYIGGRKVPQPKVPKARTPRRSEPSSGTSASPGGRR